MSSTFTIRKDDLPTEMRVLLEDYPRDSWPTHAGFKDKTRQWLGAHRSFRRLSATVRKDAESYLDGNTDAKEYVEQLVHRGGALVGNLHGHHGWEDRSYFPELSAADSRFDAGLEILERDHIALNGVLDSFTDSANRAIAMVQLDDEKHRNEVGALHTAAQTVEALLQRHLADEEELAVPIILHHRLRG